MPRNSQNRDAVLKVVLARTTPFTVKEIAAGLPTVPKGTVGAIMSRLAQSKALRVGASENGHGEKLFTPAPRMPKSVTGASRMIRRTDTRYRTRPAPRRRATRAAQAPGVATNLLDTIRGWQKKAEILDRLVADLGLTPVDLKPYSDG